MTASQNHEVNTALHHRNQAPHLIDELQVLVMRCVHAVDKVIPEELLRKHVGLPDHVAMDESLARLASTAREWYQRHGRPWSAAHLHVITQITHQEIVLEQGPVLKSERLARGFRAAKATAGIITGFSAGPEVDDEISRLWQIGRPDQAMFLNACAIAAIEHLRRQADRRSPDRR